MSFPVVEVFGPTIQGEGPEAGERCHFIRFGGCDFRCSWCDSMHAVDPAMVREAERLDAPQIIERVKALGKPGWVILSGGNPALHELGPLVERLQHLGYLVAVETQGTRWKEWLGLVDRLVVSPKPPSSGMATDKHVDELIRFMTRIDLQLAARTALKIVVADERDLVWAEGMLVAWQERAAYKHLSVMTPQDPTWSTDQLRIMVCDRFRWLCEEVARRGIDAKVSPQLHVIAWGAKLGV